MNRFLQLALLLSLFTASLPAQFESGEVLGTVRDPSGAGIPHVNVALTNQDTGIEEKTTTQDDGNYNFFNVKLGRYTLDFAHEGFSENYNQGR